MADKDTPLVERCKRLWEYAKAYYRPRNDKIERELSFALKLRHYELDSGETRDHRRLRFRGRELYSKLRRKTADIISAPLYIETLPNGAEPFSAELAETARQYYLDGVRMIMYLGEHAAGLHRARER